MPLSQEQRDLVEKHLYADETEGEQPTATLKLARRDLRFLVEAIQYFHDNCCPVDSEGEGCAMQVWGEDVHSGALEMTCAHRCEDWIKELLSDEMLSHFPARTGSAR